MMLHIRNTVFLIRFLFILIASISSILAQSGNDDDVSSAATVSLTKIRLAGLFTIYRHDSHGRCDLNSMSAHSVENSEMISYAIDRINRKPRILPGIELVWNVTADCRTDTIALNHILEIFNGRCSHENYGLENPERARGLIGPYTSAVSVPVAKLLGLFEFPQISCGATSSDLSDKQRFPSFFRTVPSDIHQIKAIIQLLVRNDWFYVSFIHENDDYGNAAFDAFQKQIRDTKICIAQELTIRRDFNDSDVEGIVRELTQDTHAKDKTYYFITLYSTQVEKGIESTICGLSDAGTEINTCSSALPIVVIAFVFERRIRSIFEQISEGNYRKDLQWIGSDAWSNLVYDTCSTGESDSQATPPSVVNGSLFFQLHSSEHKSFEEYLRTRTIGKARINNIYFAEYIARKHNCSLDRNSINPCSENLTLPEQDTGFTSRSSTCPNTVYAYAYALEDARRDMCHDQRVCDEFLHMNGSLLIKYLRNVSFVDETNFNFSFDANHDGPIRYDIMRYNSSTGCWNSIGEYSEASGISFTDEEAANGRGDVISTCSDECKPHQFRVLHETQTCCWHCLDCPANGTLNDSYVPSSLGSVETACFECDPLSQPNMTTQSCLPLPAQFLSFEHAPGLAWAVTVASSVGFVLTLIAAAVFIRFWDTPLIRASGRELSSLILVGVFLTFGLSFFFCVEPSKLICGARRFGIGFCFSLVFSGLLVKTIRISIVFNDIGKKLVREYKLFLRPTPQIVIALLLTSIEVFILIAWFLYIPPAPYQSLSPSTDPEKGPVRNIDCKAMQSMNILVGLCFPILLLLVCTCYAIKIRKVPAGFNEAKFIGFAVYTTLVIWLAQLSTYFVQITSEIQLRDAIYCLCLSLNALVVLLALFGPKVYIALLRPEKNNQATVMASNRHSTPQPSSVVRNNSTKTDDGFLGNGLRSRNPSVQLHSNGYLDTKHCTCCTLHYRYVHGNNKTKSSSENEFEKDHFYPKLPVQQHESVEKTKKIHGSIYSITEISDEPNDMKNADSSNVAEFSTSKNNNVSDDKSLPSALSIRSLGHENPTFEEDSDSLKIRSLPSRLYRASNET